MLLLMPQPKRVSQMALASSDILTYMPRKAGGYKVLQLSKILTFPSLLTHFHTELMLPKQYLSACLHHGSASPTSLQVKRCDWLDPSLPPEIRYSSLSCAIQFRDLLQDGDSTATSIVSLETSPGDISVWGD